MVNNLNAQTAEQVLKKNVQAAEDIREAAEELELVHAVLDKKIPAVAQQGDVGVAVQRTLVIGEKLNESAETLEQANELLEANLKARK